MKPKKCKDCKHCEPRKWLGVFRNWRRARCTHPDIKYHEFLCELERHPDFEAISKCGPEGHLWEAR